MLKLDNDMKHTLGNIFSSTPQKILWLFYVFVLFLWMINFPEMKGYTVPGYQLVLFRTIIKVFIWTLIVIVLAKLIGKKEKQHGTKRN